jgi:Right handed beta helix region
MILAALRGIRRRKALPVRFTVLALEDRRLLSSFEVTSTADNLNFGTLRWAVAQANTASSPTTITFNLGSSPATIVLTLGPLALTNSAASIAIDGPGADLLSISGDNESPVLEVDEGSVSLSGFTITATTGDGLINESLMTLTGCTLTGNSAAVGGAALLNQGRATLTDCTVSGNSTRGLFNDNAYATLAYCNISRNTGVGLYNLSGSGAVLAGCTISGNADGGLLNDSKASLTNCTISGNSSDGGFGAGLINGSFYQATATLVDCTISGNSAAGGGGGLFDNPYCQLTLTGCTVSGNSAAGAGGGVSNLGNVYISDSTIIDNSGGSGGGVCNSGSINLTDCTISGNSSFGGGGGLANFLTVVKLELCTISGNSAARGGGGVYNYSPRYGMFLLDTIVAGNFGSGGSASDIGGAGAGGVMGVSNLIGIGGYGGLATAQSSDLNLLNVANPGLAPLANNGGPTETMALLPGSPAIGAGAETQDSITTDQRGEPLDSPPDIGAYQTQGSGTLVPTPAPTPTPTPTPSPGSNPTPPPTPLVTVQSARLETIKIGKGKNAKKETVIEVVYSAAVNAASAGNAGAYELAPVFKVKASGKGKNRKPATTKLGAAVPVASAVYSNDQVTLTPRGKLTASKPEELIVNGSLLTDTLGREVDGNDNGQPGGDFIATVTGSRLTSGGIPLARVRRQLTAADVIDRLLARGDLAEVKPSVRA